MPTNSTNVADLFDDGSRARAAKFTLRQSYPDLTTAEEPDVLRSLLTFRQRSAIVYQLQHEAEGLIAHAMALAIETQNLLEAGQLSEDAGLTFLSASEVFGGC